MSQLFCYTISEPPEHVPDGARKVPQCAAVCLDCSASASANATASWLTNRFQTKFVHTRLWHGSTAVMSYI